MMRNMKFPCQTMRGEREGEEISHLIRKFNWKIPFHAAAASGKNTENLTKWSPSLPVFVSASPALLSHVLRSHPAKHIFVSIQKLSRQWKIREKILFSSFSSFRRLSLAWLAAHTKMLYLDSRVSTAPTFCYLQNSTTPYTLIWLAPLLLKYYSRIACRTNIKRGMGRAKRREETARFTYRERSCL